MPPQKQTHTEHKNGRRNKFRFAPWRICFAKIAPPLRKIIKSCGRGWHPRHPEKQTHIGYKTVFIPQQKGARHLDAEGVIWFSSAYKSTPESQSATKKPHKKRKKPTDFCRWVSTLYWFVENLMKIQVSFSVWLLFCAK